MHAITADGWAFVVSLLRHFTFTKFYQLKDLQKTQVFFLVDKIVALNGQGVDGLVVGLLRQIVAGDHGKENSEVSMAILRLLTRNRDWLHSQTTLIPFVFYSIGRLGAEEGLDQPILEASLSLLKDLLNNRYRECRIIGRDFARVMQALSHFEVMRGFWAWFTAPTDPSNPFSAPISEVLKQPSQKKYIACRLTPLMETEILYMMEHVKTLRQSYYETWFQEAHVPKGPSDDPNALISDLIRYIVAVYHPSNAVLAAPIVQRWSVITWLYKMIINEKAAFDAQLAIFFDWFFFDPTVDSIMNVEPGCLVLVRGIAKLPVISIGALSYLLFYRHQFGHYPVQAITKNIDLAMRVCLEKGVVSSLEGLIKSPTLDSSSKQLVFALFPSGVTFTAPPSAAPSQDSKVSSGSSSATTSSSTIVSPKSPTNVELDSDEELTDELAQADLARYDLLMQKIKALEKNSAMDEVLVGLVQNLRVLESRIKDSTQRRNLIGSDLLLKGLDARVKEILGLESANEPLELPTTSADFSKFKAKLLSSPELFEFPSGPELYQIAQSSVRSGATEQIWIWKSLVSMLQVLPVERLKGAPDTLRQSFSLIDTENEILSTGLLDACMMLHSRYPIIPKIFDGLQDDSEAFRTFVEQAIIMSRT